MYTQTLTSIWLLDNDVEVLLEKMFAKFVQIFDLQRVLLVILKTLKRFLRYELGEYGGHFVTIIKFIGILGKIKCLNLIKAGMSRDTVYLNSRL